MLQSLLQANTSWQSLVASLSGLDNTNMFAQTWILVTLNKKCLLRVPNGPCHSVVCMGSNHLFLWALAFQNVFSSSHNVDERRGDICLISACELLERTGTTEWGSSNNLTLCSCPSPLSLYDHFLFWSSVLCTSACSSP